MTNIQHPKVSRKFSRNHSPQIPEFSTGFSPGETPIPQPKAQDRISLSFISEGWNTCAYKSTQP